MFEHFTGANRRIMQVATAEARASGLAMISCDHLLLAIAQCGQGPAIEALTGEGLSHRRLRELIDAGPEPLDGEALALVGIDLDAVTRATEAAFGPGALDRAGRALSAKSGGRTRLAPDAKVAIELAVKHAHRTKQRTITPGHILVGLLDQGDSKAIAMLERAGVRPGQLRLATLLRMAAAS
jgi:ClpA/ClpB-like protein